MTYSHIMLCIFKMLLRSVMRLLLQMDLTCFIAMMIFLQSANATFQAFSQGQNRISLDYNQFIYACGNVV